MSSRLNIWGACRSLATRARPITPQSEALLRIAAQRRFLSDSTEKPGSGEPKVDSRLQSMNQGSLQKVRLFEVVYSVGSCRVLRGLGFMRA